LELFARLYRDARSTKLKNLLGSFSLEESVELWVIGMITHGWASENGSVFGFFK